ncbi:MAG: helix-turn-helix transcriptional regulator [Paludibacteraceae bacterium]|nr:helix-turn-helix transcriptional regulator [Paludibacteraceae bacterium]
MSQAKLAEKSDMSGSALSAYERSTKIPSLFTVAKIARALQVSIERLYYGDDNNAFINQTPDEGRKIVNCFYHLWTQDIFYYYEDVAMPNMQQQYYDNRGYIKEMNLYVRKHTRPIHRLINSLNEYRDKKKTYDDPEIYLEMILSSVASEINDEIEEEEQREKARKEKASRPRELGTGAK